MKENMLQPSSNKSSYKINWLKLRTTPKRLPRNLKLKSVINIKLASQKNELNSEFQTKINRLEEEKDSITNKLDQMKKNMKSKEISL